MYILYKYKDILYTKLRADRTERRASAASARPFPLGAHLGQTTLRAGIG